ncbi:LuxR family transcriptional regulator [Burkholderia ubonensis]|uniref:LuxR family transcriptional regulator n=1 Tax=Burkholderia ubonensis TaxID=101571 RepID=UPI000A9B8675|nr:LuxR family transcriptional regulator [Burkholderia ubonensis]
MSTSERDGTLGDFIGPMTSTFDSMNESWFDALSRQTVSYGFEYVMLVIYPRVGLPGETIFIRGTYPAAWQAIYFSRRYDRIDPVLAHCVAHSTPIFWSANTFITDAQRTMYEEACLHGLCAGVALPIHGPQLQVGMLCVASNGLRDVFFKNVNVYLPELLMLRDQVAENSSRYLNMHFGFEAPKLTPREHECLKWVAQGKSTWEISRILSCSEGTVNFHVKNIRRKFEVPTRREAVVIAMSLGIISFD